MTKKLEIKFFNDFNTHEPLLGDIGYYTLPLLREEYKNEP